MIFKRYQSSNNDRTIQGTSAGWRRWRRLWRGWIVIPTGIGVSVFTVLQWRRQSWNNQPQSTNASKNFQITCYRAIPLRAMSRAWGWISSQHVPLSIRCWLYTGYARMYGVNLEEAAHSLEHYNSLCEFFIRQLKEGVRPVAEYEPIVSPADGSIVNAGIVNSCNVEQIKGVTYTIKTFLGEPTWNELGRLKEKSDNDEANTLPSSQLQLTNGGGGGGGLRSQGDREHRPLYDESRRTPSKLLRLRHKNNDAVMNNLDNGGCELLHLGLNDAYQCNNEISADIKNDFRVLGWLVFYFQFCIKDLLINSFYIGFQIIYGIKSSIVLSNGKILKGASFLRSQFSFGNGTSTFNTRIDASTDTGLTYSTDCTTDCNDSSDDDDDDDMDEAKCYDPDWNEYKKQLLHNEDNELYQFVVYLAPGDYHRFHSPADLKIKFRRHFQGELLSVHPKIAQLIPELFSLNERAVYVGEWKHGFFSMVAVGATNVGSIKVHTDKDLLTNTRRWKHGPRFKDKELDVEWKKGEEVGEFRLGSTIVLLFEAPKDFHFSVKPDQKIRVGEPVTSFITEDSNYS